MWLVKQPMSPGASDPKPEGCWQSGGNPGKKGASDPKPKGKGKGGKGKKMSQDDQPSGEKLNEEVAGLFIGAVSRHERYNRQDWLAWKKDPETGAASVEGLQEWRPW